LDTQIENEHQEIRKGYPDLRGGPHYNGAADGWYRSTHENINNLVQEKKEVKRMEKQLLKTTVSIAPYTREVKIPKNTLDKTIRDSGFEFFRADFGMNINVPVGKLKEIRFYLSLIGDRKISEQYDDLIEKINIVSGTLKIAINDFMNIIPVSMIQSVSKIIKIDLNPLNFNWNYKRVKVLFSEGLSYKADWYLSSKNLNQDFNCTIIFKKRIGVKKVIGRVKAIWSYEPLHRMKIS